MNDFIQTNAFSRLKTCKDIDITKCSYCSQVWKTSSFTPWRSSCSIYILAEELGNIPKDDIKQYFIKWLKPHRYGKHHNTIYIRTAIKYCYPEYLDLFDKLAVLL